MKDSDYYIRQAQHIEDSDYYIQQAQQEIDRLWETGELNEQKIEEFRKMHMRTPYKKR